MEDLKFKLKRAEFDTSSSGTLTLNKCNFSSKTLDNKWY